MSNITQSEKNKCKEIDAVVERYAKRLETVDPKRYESTRPSVYLAQQERQRALIYLINKYLSKSVVNSRVLEVGCGTGGNILELLQLGFQSSNLVANDLLEDRLSVARERLPSGVTFLEGDARNLDFKDTSFDIVIQSTVFSSILDNSVQEDLAQKMWQWVMPGGCVLWYDFIYNNPKNPDVRGVPIKRIRELFPGGDIFVKKVTLAPPIARFITSITPNLYSFFNLFPILRTHVLCWIKKQ